MPCSVPWSQSSAHGIQHQHTGPVSAASAAQLHMTQQPAGHQASLASAAKHMHGCDCNTPAQQRYRGLVTSRQGTGSAQHALVGSGKTDSTASGTASTCRIAACRWRTAAGDCSAHTTQLVQETAQPAGQGQQTCTSRDSSHEGTARGCRAATTWAQHTTETCCTQLDSQRHKQHRQRGRRSAGSQRSQRACTP
jgi:hypothetical protein